jgi:hypothetical protein
MKTIHGKPGLGQSIKLSSRGYDHIIKNLQVSSLCYCISNIWVKQFRTCISEYLSSLLSSLSKVNQPNQEVYIIMSFYHQVMNTVQVLILIIIAVFIIVMVATFFFLPMFTILNTITQGLDGQEVLLSSIIPWT